MLNCLSITVGPWDDASITWAKRKHSMFVSAFRGRLHTVKRKHDPQFTPLTGRTAPERLGCPRAILQSIIYRRPSSPPGILHSFQKAKPGLKEAKMTKKKKKEN
ncbi:hypothetical protein PoB_003577100 [Plakobranchus ocellatus]|uniref:Uncharacterized protein n=1 Tax=Plakobranchus ocellatus TaxID=259542 RepID=A0AAV4ADL1_9GAST|nr:hypothetical protein PoB_003577100 [Plakobranchus ocellatus]